MTGLKFRLSLEVTVRWKVKRISGISAKTYTFKRKFQSGRSSSSGGVGRPDFDRLGARASASTSDTFWSPSATVPVLYWQYTIYINHHKSRFSDFLDNVGNAIKRSISVE